MIAKLRSNFNLSNALVRILFVLTFVLANWQTCLAATLLVFERTNLWMALSMCLILGVAFMFLLPVLVNFALNMVRIYSVPRAEYCLLAHAFFALGNLILGLLKLVNLFTPALLVWGGVLFPLISSLIAAVLFYKVTAKLYFNDLTVVYYFKMFAIVYLVILLVMEVL